MIPKDEQPYKIPDNWRWTYIKSVAEVVTGSTPSKKCPQYYGGNFPFFKPADLDVGRHVIKASEYLSDEGKAVSRIIPAHSTAVCCIGSIGKCGYLEIEGTTNQQINAAIPKINPLYFYYYCLTDNFINELLSKASATTISIVNKTKMENCLFPLPPLDEQQHIVDIIENLFAKLDRAKALVQNVIDNYELRRSAILHRAFNGELIKCNFQRMTINSICKSLIYGTSKKSSKFGKTAVIRMGNLQNGEIDWSNLAYSDDDEEIEKYNLSVGDVLFNRTNSAELVGKTSIYRGEYPAIYAGYLIKLDYNHNILIGDYFNYMLNAPEAKDYCQRVKTDGVNQSNINAKKIGAFEVPIPNIEEQKEIVRILDSLLAKEQRTKELAEKVLQKIDLVKKAILARAFRGELKTNEVIF